MFHEVSSLLQTSLLGGGGGGAAIFFLLLPTTCFQERCRNPVSLRAPALFLTAAGPSRWIAQTETRMAGDEIKFFSLNASLNHIPLKLQHRYSLYCSIRPHNFSVWRWEAKFRRVALSILTSWNWLRVQCWILCCSSPGFSCTGSCFGGGSAYHTPANPSLVW